MPCDPQNWQLIIKYSNNHKTNLFRYTWASLSSSPFLTSGTTHLSARRHTVRATCNDVLALPPPWNIHYILWYENDHRNDFKKMEGNKWRINSYSIPETRDNWCTALLTNSVHKPRQPGHILWECLILFIVCSSWIVFTGSLRWKLKIYINIPCHIVWGMVPWTGDF